ncbi:4-alpha-glucanotransferase [candidate division GN15 bacterium]|nr:4-alpha-glucanotransferase [candidate division GN15 bacterium]
MIKQRSSGILLHVTSLPSAYGIGDLGHAARQFIDMLHRAGQNLWQVLPLQPVNGIHHYSPYSGSSAFAGNRYLISPQSLVEQQYLKPEDLDGAPKFPDDHVDFPAVTKLKRALLDRSWERYQERDDTAPFDSFCRQEAAWLDDYALYAVAKQVNDLKGWNDWPQALRDRDPKALNEFSNRYAGQLRQTKFEQYLFFRQWDDLKAYANERQIQVFGDLPIYITYDSADVWANPELFKLNEKRQPTVVAGVPPDYFSKTGQLWGNPVYNWDELKGQDYDWWLRRLEQMFRLYDIVRIDHFRGLVAYWEVPSHHKTAVNGEWVEAPVDDFLTRVHQHFENPRVIAEDLGTITDDVVEVMKRYKLPGMKVLEFAFGEDNPKHKYLPENYDEDSVVYTGTHDNNTIVGWYQNEADEKTLKRLERYLGTDVTADDVHWHLIKLALDSRAKLAVFPIQDILGLDQSARMNTPGTAKGNWVWRLTPEQMAIVPVEKLADLTEKSDR